MSFTAATLVALAAMALATFATRAAGLLLARYIPSQGRARSALDALPAAVLIAVIAPAATAGPAEVLATALTVLAACRLPLLGVVALAMVAIAVLRRFLG